MRLGHRQRGGFRVTSDGASNYGKMAAEIFSTIASASNGAGFNQAGLRDIACLQHMPVLAHANPIPMVSSPQGLTRSKGDGQLSTF